LVIPAVLLNENLIVAGVNPPPIFAAHLMSNILLLDAASKSTILRRSCDTCKRAVSELTGAAAHKESSRGPRPAERAARAGH